MSYSIDITRKETSCSDEGSEISMDEWLEYVNSDPEMELYEYSEDDENVYVNYFRNEGLAVWTKYSEYHVDGKRATFAYRGGTIDLINPIQETVIKAYAIAQSLNAKVKGIGCEEYDVNGYTDYSDPFHIYSLEVQTLSCARQSDGRFHVCQPGIAPIIVTGYEHILIKDPVFSVLQELCSDSAEFKEATVMQVVKGDTFEGYYEVIPHEEVTPETIKKVDGSGCKLWHFNKKYLFVSNAVRNELFKLNNQNLSFTPGFCHFG